MNSHTTSDKENECFREDIIGTWKLMSAEDRNSPNDPWVPYTFGNPPSGYFVYDATGHASIQIMTTPPQQIGADGPTPEQALAIYNNYIAYYGTYTIDAQNITVNVEGSLVPTQVGGPQARPYELNGDTLIVGDQVTYIRTLKRMPVTP